MWTAFSCCQRAPSAAVLNAVWTRESLETRLKRARNLGIKLKEDGDYALATLLLERDFGDFAS